MASGNSQVDAENDFTEMLEKLLRLLEKHRLIFLYLAVPQRINPLAVNFHNPGCYLEELPRDQLPSVPVGTVDEEGEFLFTYRYVIEKFAQTAVGRFGVGLGDKPHTIDSTGRVLEVEGGSYPFWVIDECACMHLEASVDEILAVCRDMLRSCADPSIPGIIRRTRGALYNEGQTKWYPKAVEWSYLMRLDETLHWLRVAEFGISAGAGTGKQQQVPTTVTEPDDPAGPKPAAGSENISNPTQPPKFPTPKGSSWADVCIRFLDGETISIKVRDQLRQYAFIELGLVDGRNKKPSKQWELLREFARTHGRLTWVSPGSDRKNQKRREVLAKQLKEFFGIAGDPIEYLDGEKGWRTVFYITE